jgi:hypothetical protein
MQCKCTGAEQLGGDVTASSCLSVVWISHIFLLSYGVTCWLYFLFPLCQPFVMAVASLFVASWWWSKSCLLQILFGVTPLIIIWVDSMMTEHFNQPSNLCGTVAHTFKLSEDSVTTLVTTFVFMVPFNEFMTMHCSVASGMGRNKGLYIAPRLELKG